MPIIRAKTKVIKYSLTTNVYVLYFFVLGGIVGAQDMLTEADWQKANIRSVVNAAIEPHVDGGHRFTVEGPSVDLTAQQGLGLSLAVHELATNATKYGALSVEKGYVIIRWTVEADRDRRRPACHAASMHTQVRSSA